MAWLTIALVAQLHVAANGIRFAAQQPGWPKDYWGDDLDMDPSIAAEGDGALQMRQRSRPGHYVILYPPKKLAFCFIPKVACKNFNWMFSKMNGLKRDFGAASLDHFGLTEADVSREKGWRWAVFLRNPLLRYLSAWGDKCVHMHNENCVTEISTTWNVSAFEHHVLETHKRPEVLRTNPHWEPQQDACGGLRGTDGYDFVGHLEGDVTGQVHKMLRMVGAPEDLVEEFFPRGKIAQHKTLLDPDLYYRNDTIRQYVHDLYLSDFDLPGL